MAVLEICAFNLDDAYRAAATGAERIELCREPAADGLTPRTDDLRSAASLLGLVPVHPIVRPRPSFEVTPADEHDMAHTLRQVRDLGYPGAVIGALDSTGTAPDWHVIERLAAAGEGLALTFHRAFDAVRDQPAALHRLADLGIVRVLTSGRPGAAIDHVDVLRDLTRTAADVGITVMAGGSVTSANAPALLAAGIAELHASAGGSSGRMCSSEVAALAAVARAG